jgi:DNA-binding MarR family transcriptional regulator
MKRLVTQLSGFFELQIRMEKALRSLDLTLSASGLPLTFADFRALGCILAAGPISLKQSADALEVPKTTIHYIIGKLETKGFVDRAYAKRKKAPVFTCTPAGREAWNRAIRALGKGPIGSAVFAMSPGELSQHVTGYQSFWAAAGADAQNEPLRQEAAILAAFAAEALLQATGESEECFDTKPRNERHSLLS